jgi:ligand-binding sensor protein
LLHKICDINQFTKLMESFYQLDGIPHRLCDIKGNILSSVGCTNLCKNFHRKNPISAKRCSENNLNCKKVVKQEKGYSYYICQNGLIEAVLPIYINNVHIGNLKFGEFLFDEPNIDFFRGQAIEFGFNEEEYIEALRKTPVISKTWLDNGINAFYALTNILAAVMYSNYEAKCAEEELIDHNEKLQLMVEERTSELEKNNIELQNYILMQEEAVTELEKTNQMLKNEIIKRQKTEGALQESEEQLNALINNLPLEFWAADRNLHYNMQNATSLKNYGSVIGKDIYLLDIPEELKEKWAEEEIRALKGDILRSTHEIIWEGKRKVIETNFHVLLYLMKLKCQTYSC